MRRSFFAGNLNKHLSKSAFWHKGSLSFLFPRSATYFSAPPASLRNSILYLDGSKADFFRFLLLIQMDYYISDYQA